MRKRLVNVAIVGNCYYDKIWKVLNILGVEKRLGGSATNTAVSLKRGD